MNRRFAALLAPIVLAACSSAAASSPTASKETATPGCSAAVTLTLQPGESHLLTEQEARCFSLSAASGAEYALAGYDARTMEALQGGTAPASLAEPRYTVSDRSTGGAAASQSLMAAPAQPVPTPAGHMRFSQAASTTSGDVYSRSTPWREGDRFQVRPMVGTGTVPAHVVRVVANRYVLAVVDSDESGAGKVLEQAGKALDYIAANGEPLMRKVFGDRFPVTSTGSGQLLILAAAWDPENAAAATWNQESANGVQSYVWFNTNLRPGKGDGYEMYDHVSYRLKVLAHELTHAYQVAYLRATTGSSLPGSAAWSVEGGADFVSMDVLRRYLGVTAGANWSWTDHLNPREDEVVYAMEPAAAQGRLPWGYYDAASLLRDLQNRLASSGMSADDAMAEVSRGAVEGWYGDDGEGGTHLGLVERMRARLGGTWDPAGAVLSWTLAQAADDRTSNKALNNPSYRKVGDSDVSYGWKAIAEVRAGNGGTASFGQVTGGSFFVKVKGAGSASTMSVNATVPGVRWMIARTS